MRGSKILKVMRDMIEKRMPKIFEFATVMSNYPDISIQVDGQGDGQGDIIKKEFLVIPERLANAQQTLVVRLLSNQPPFESEENYTRFHFEDGTDETSSVEITNISTIIPDAVPRVANFTGALKVYGYVKGTYHGLQNNQCSRNGLAAGDRVIVQLLSDQQRYLIVDRIAED